MILSGSIDHDRVARSAAVVRDAAHEARVEAARRSAEHAIDTLLASWRDDRSDLHSAHVWEAHAMDVIDGLSALLADLDLARSEPLLISQRTGS
jgi:hypothetical protein